MSIEEPESPTESSGMSLLPFVSNAWEVAPHLLEPGRAGVWQNRSRPLAVAPPEVTTPNSAHFGGVARTSPCTDQATVAIGFVLRHDGPPSRVLADRSDWGGQIYQHSITTEGHEI